MWCSCKAIPQSNAQVQLQAWQRSLEMVLLGAAALAFVIVAGMSSLAAPTAGVDSGEDGCTVASDPEIELEARCVRRESGYCVYYEYVWIVSFTLSVDGAHERNSTSTAIIVPGEGTFREAKEESELHPRRSKVPCDPTSVQEGDVGLDHSPQGFKGVAARGVASAIGWSTRELLLACRIVRNELPPRFLEEVWPVLTTAALSIVSRSSERNGGESAGPCVGSMLVALAMGCASLLRGLGRVANIADYSTAYLGAFALGALAVALVRVAIFIAGTSDFPEMSKHLDESSHERLGTGSCSLSVDSTADSAGSTSAS